LKANHNNNNECNSKLFAVYNIKDTIFES